MAVGLLHRGVTLGPLDSHPVPRGQVARLAYRLGRSSATGVLSVSAERSPAESLVVRRGAVIAAPSDERGQQARTRLARLAAGDDGRWWFDGGQAPYPPGAAITVPLAAWARSHLEAQLDSRRAEALTAELAGRRLTLVTDHGLPADLLDEADRRIVVAMARPRRLDQLWTEARIPRFRLLSFLHFLRQVGVVAVDALGAHDSGAHRVSTAAAPAVPAATLAALRTLGLPGPVDKDAIKRAYRRLARTLHPDLQPGVDDERRKQLEARLVEVSAAAATLLG